MLGLCQKGKRQTALGGQIKDLVLLLLSLGFLKFGVPEVSELSSSYGEDEGKIGESQLLVRARVS